MGIEVGHTLDKYELLEKVGQGGMAVVYRGRDTALKREVAVKVLHRHLADHAEARDRFEREAQAVAKLRHENILEIFDYSGRSSDESYIVTEFIAGQTLKEFITERELGFPEIGAMIAVQIGRALGHAHASGVLHRDVKPENVMIRNDGVVKLTDFGIAQMLDVQRLTMTGQLLGSPAYMAPEHVEGKALDIRSDVFAVGVVLYQLVTGELPFKGRNAHEILKRIAEGRYPEPSGKNPRVGARLAGIIRRALARDPDDRYRDVPELVAALAAYLAESGIEDAAVELAGFFAGPEAYEAALRPRLVAALIAGGRARLAGDRNRALEMFNRVLTLDPDNREVVREIERLSRRSKARLLFGAVLAAGAVVGGARWLGAAHDGGAPPTAVGRPEPAARGTDRARPRDADGEVPVAEVTTPDAAPAATTDPARPDRAIAPRPGPAPGAAPAAPAPPAAARRAFTLNVSPWRGSQLSVDGGPWRPIERNRDELELGPERATVRVRNPACCLDAEQVIESDRAAGVLEIQLAFAPASVTPRCARAGVTATVDGKPWDLGQPAPIPITAMTGRVRGTVTFTDGQDYLREVPYVLSPAESMDVPCP